MRVVNVIDLLVLDSVSGHPHRMDDTEFERLFTADRPVVFTFHGYPSAIHQLIYKRANPERFHVRGYVEEGTTTTPFDMLVRNQTSRYHLVIKPCAAREVFRQGGADHRAIRAEAARPPALYRSGRGRSAGDTGLVVVNAGGQILALNAGSSTLKLGLFDAATEAQLAASQIGWRDDGATQPEAMRDLLAAIDTTAVTAVGHRVVHGGARFTSAVAIDTEVRDAIAELAALAPLHNRPALAVIEAMIQLRQACRRWRCSTPRSTPRCRRMRTSMPSRTSGTNAGGCAASGFTG